MLQGKVTIGLNQAYKYGKFTYHLSVHPEVIRPFQNARWITKGKKLNHSGRDLPRNYYYLFESNSDVHDFSLVETPEAAKLYLGRGIHTTAVHLAALMGAKVIYLYGVDCTSFKTLHHGHQQHVQFYGLNPKDTYREYYENLVILRKLLWNKYRCHIVSVTPFAGIGYHDEDIDRLMEMMGREYPTEPPEEKRYTRQLDKFL